MIYDIRLFVHTKNPDRGGAHIFINKDSERYSTNPRAIIETTAMNSNELLFRQIVRYAAHSFCHIDLVRLDMDFGRFGSLVGCRNARKV